MKNSLKNRKNTLIEELAKVGLNKDKWLLEISNAMSHSDLEDIYARIVILGKKHFLLRMLSELSINNEIIKNKISRACTVDSLNKIADTIKLAFYKQNLKNNLAEFDLLREIDTKRIDQSASIEEVNRKTVALREKLNFHLMKKDELSKSLYGSEYISTCKSIRAILTGMIY